MYLAGGYLAVPDPGAAAVNRQGHAPLAFPLRRAGTSEQGFAQFQHVRQQGLLILAERSVAIAKQQQSGPWKAFLVAQCFAGEQVQLAAVLVQGSSGGIEGKQGGQGEGNGALDAEVAEQLAMHVDEQDGAIATRVAGET